MKIKLSELGAIKEGSIDLSKRLKRLERYDIRLRGRIEDYDQSSPGQTYTTYFTEWVRVTTY